MRKVNGTERRFRTLKRTDKSIIIFYRFLKETTHLRENNAGLYTRYRSINTNFFYLQRTYIHRVLKYHLTCFRPISKKQSLQNICS